MALPQRMRESSVSEEDRNYMAWLVIQATLRKSPPKIVGERLLSEGEELVLDHLIEHGAAVSVAIATALPTLKRERVCQITATLERKGYVVWTEDTTPTRGGRTPRLWRVTDEGRRAAITPNPDVWR